MQTQSSLPTTHSQRSQHYESSRTGAGSNRAAQTANAVISQEDDIPEQEEEEARSTSTLFMAQVAAAEARFKSKNQDVEEARRELDRRFVQTTITQSEVEHARVETRGGRGAGNLSREAPTSLQSDSFQNVFKKRKLGTEDESSVLNPDDRPWYYFEGNTSHAISQSNHQSIALDESQKQDHERLYPVQEHQNVELRESPAVAKKFEQAPKTSENKESSADGVVDLYSTSNVNTPNQPPRQRSKAIGLTSGDRSQPQQPPSLQGILSRGTSGRIQLRSVYLSSTEEMKADADMARIHDQKSSLAAEGQAIKPESQIDPVQVVEGGLSPTLLRQSPKVRPSASPTSVSEQNGVGSARRAKPVKSANIKNEKISVSHNENLFYTTEKKRLGAAQKRYSQEANVKQQQQEMNPLEDQFVINPALDIKIRSHQVGLNANVGGQPGKILTPSFTSQEVHAAKQRRSDLLLMKKEPSLQANGRSSIVEDYNSSALDQSLGSNANGFNASSALRESRYSLPNNNPAAAAQGVVVNQHRLSRFEKERPVILWAGTPAAIQPQIGESDSSMILASSSKFSQAIFQPTWTGSARGTNVSHDILSRSSKRMQGSAFHQNSSFSRKSIAVNRKSTVQDEDAELTGFAYYMKNFFNNLFTCCGGGGGLHNQHDLRSSLNTSTHSNVLQYSFVAVPNNNPSSIDTNGSKLAQTGLEQTGQVRRSQLIKDFRAQHQPINSAGQAKQRPSILDTDRDLEEADLDEESDIVCDEDHMAQAQMPLNSARLHTAKRRVDSASQRVYSSNQSQMQRVTCGTVEIATQITSDSHVDEFVYQPAAMQSNPNPFTTVRPLKPSEDEKEQSEGNVHDSASVSKHQSQMPAAHQSKKLPASTYDVPRSLSNPDMLGGAAFAQPFDAQGDSEQETPSDYSNQDQSPYSPVTLPPGAILKEDSAKYGVPGLRSDSGKVSPPSRKQPQRKKRSLKDMITQVPQGNTQQMYQNVVPSQQHLTVKGRPSAASQNSRNSSQGRSYEGPSHNSFSEEDGHSDSSGYLQDDQAVGGGSGEYGDGEETPDVQRIHFNQTVQALFNIRASGLTMPPFEMIAHQLVNLPQPNHPSKTKTVVFDLDETLIHCVDDVETDNPDVIIPIQFSEEPEPVLAGINIRPFARECLEAANEHFQVVIFTASEQEYADPIIDYLDPDGSLIQARFYRPSCVRTRNPDFYVKDMRIFHQRALSDIILVDNSVYSFAFQLDNGVPIVSFYDDPKDEEMLHLKFYLDCLKDSTDVRIKNKDAFQLVQLAETQWQRIVEEQAALNSPSPASLPYQRNNYTMPEAAQYANSSSFVLEELPDDEEDDDFERDPTEPEDHILRRHALTPSQQQLQQQQQMQDAKRVAPQSNIIEADEQFEEEQESFECRL